MVLFSSNNDRPSNGEILWATIEASSPLLFSWTFEDKFMEERTWDKDSLATRTWSTQMFLLGGRNEAGIKQRQPLKGVTKVPLGCIFVTNNNGTAEFWRLEGWIFTFGGRL